MAAMEEGNQGVEEHAVFVVLVSWVFEIGRAHV